MRIQLLIVFFLLGVFCLPVYSQLIPGKSGIPGIDYQVDNIYRSYNLPAQSYYNFKKYPSYYPLGYPYSYAPSIQQPDVNVDVNVNVKVYIEEPKPSAYELEKQDYDARIDYLNALQDYLDYHYEVNPPDTPLPDWIMDAIDELKEESDKRDQEYAVQQERDQMQQKREAQEIYNSLKNSSNNETVYMQTENGNTYEVIENTYKTEKGKKYTITHRKLIEDSK